MRLCLALLLITLSSYGQQVIRLCPDERNTFTYWSTSNTAGEWVWLMDDDTLSEDYFVTITWDSLGVFDIVVRFYNGCDEIPRTYVVYVLECLRSAMYFPNAFTPNGDGVNDSWKPIGIGVDRIRWWIFDRWGLEIYKADDESDVWDGCMDYKGDRRPCQADVYVWLADWVDVLGTSHNRTGRVTIAR